jgi:hypothetical protein
MYRMSPPATIRASTCKFEKRLVAMLQRNQAKPSTHPQAVEFTLRSQ